MDASTVRAVMALIPERVARVQSGSAFPAPDPAARNAERIARLGRFLHWMSPLGELPREEQQALGLLNAAGRPVHAADLEEEADLDAEPLAGQEEPLAEDAMA